MRINLKRSIYLLSVFIVSLVFTNSSCDDEIQEITETADTTTEGIIKLYTTDGGETWGGHTIWPFPDAIANDITFNGETKLIIAGQQRAATSIIGLVLTSTDGGDSWRKEAENLQLGVLHSVFSSFHTTVAGENSSMGFTTNLGTSWSYASLNSSDMNIKSVAYNFAGTIGIAVGNCLQGANDTSFIYRSTDIGQTWTKVSTMLFYIDYMNFNDVVFTDYTEALVVSDWGSFMKSTNAGQSWFVTHTTGVRTPLNRISLPFNSNIGLAAGENGRIIKTVDGGNNWFNIETGIQAELFDVIYINPNLAFAVGEKVILKSTNNGNTWVRKTIPYSFRNSTLRSVYFFDENQGYIVGGD